MRFIFLSDVHLSGYSQDKIIDDLPERLQIKKKVLYSIGSYCVENKIDKIIIGGDLFNDKSKIFTLALDLIVEYFRHFSGIEHILISGNHDLSGKGSTAVSALKALENEPNVTHIGPGSQLQIENILLIP